MSVQLDRFFVAVLVTIVSTEAASKGYYRAAVVEQRVGVSGPINKRVNASETEAELIHNYQNFMIIAHEQYADVIVFPEAGLYYGYSDYTSHFIPHPSLKVAPVDSMEYDQHVRQLSELARKYSMYLAVNLLEKVKHSDNRITKYITNVVFDRDGRVVARYKKFNLFGEPVNRTANIGPSYFDSDFGVRFGQLIGLDILYKQPAYTLMNEYNITDFIYSSQWFSELPFLTSVQAQWMWSVGNEVNLLASGLNHIEHGISGSGIYRAKKSPMGSLYVFGDDVGSAIIIGNVSIGAGPELDYSGKGEFSSKYRSGRKKFPLLKQGELELMANANIDLPGDQSKDRNQLQIANVTKHVCQGLLCCTFNFVVRFRLKGPKVLYKAVVFDGTRTSKAPYTKLVQGVQICGIVLCKDKSMSSCGPPAVEGHLPNMSTLKPSVNFTLIEISGNFTKNDSSIMPNLLLWPKRPDTPTDGIVDKDGEYLVNPKIVKFFANASNDMSTLRLKLQHKIISGGIFSRVYSRDARYTTNDSNPETIRKSGTSKIRNPSFVLLLPFIKFMFKEFKEV